MAMAPAVDDANNSTMTMEKKRFMRRLVVAKFGQLGGWGREEGLKEEGVGQVSMPLSIDYSVISVNSNESIPNRCYRESPRHPIPGIPPALFPPERFFKILWDSSRGFFSHFFGFLGML